YDGCIIEKSEAIVVPDTEETLLLAKESHSKMIEKENDPQMFEKKVVTKPINYDILNKLSTDFETRFVSQTESSAEQAFCSQYSVQTDEPMLEKAKVSMVNSCLKKLKFHIASFDMVVKERTTATAITKCTWGFEHTKACFRDDIIPFVKSLKELFTSFDQCLIDEVTEVQNVFTQMELAVEQHCEEKSKSVCLNVTACARCVTTETELKTEFFNNECYDMLLQKYHTLEKHCITLEVNNQLNTELFQMDTWCSQESAPTFAELFEINNLKAQAQVKDTVILKLKEKLNSLNGDVKDRDAKQNVEDMETLNIELDHKEKVLVITALKEQLDKLKGKAVITEAVTLNPIDPELLKVDVTPVVLKLRKNRTAHIDYIRNTQGEAATLRKIVESERLLSPLNTSLDYACKYTRRIQELLVILQQTCPYLTDIGTKLETVVQIILWYLDSGCSKHMTGDHSQLVNFVKKFLGTVKFGNDHVAKIMGYGDYQIGNVTISQLTGSWGNNLYTQSIQDMMASSPICLLSKASKTKSWLWHRRLSHLNFGAINHLARQGLVRGLPKLKFEKDHLCSACAMVKSTRKIHKPKSEDTNQEKLYLLHMDLCGLMR
nr:hypothetical protein [Tanacetum cinerariifolium]